MVERARHRGGLLAVLVLLVSLPACTQERVQPERGTVIQVGDGVAGLVNPPSDGSSGAARISGTLAVIEGDCLGLSLPGPDQALAFPHGTTAATGGTGVTTPEGLTILVGQDLVAGGGVREIDPGANWILERWPAAPPGCSGAETAAGIDDIELLPAQQEAQPEVG